MAKSVPHILRAMIRRLRRHVMCFGFLGDTVPVNPGFGINVGTPIDRYYIEDFLKKNASDIKNHVLEIGGRTYTERYGEAVRQSDILAHEASDEAVPTIVADLANCPAIPDDTYDCIILAQTLFYLPDMAAGVREVQRILKPGGVVLCTVSGISQISRHDMNLWGDRWRLTSLGARELFESAFGPDHIDISVYGNVFSATCFLQGIVTEHVPLRKLDVFDPDYELLVCVRAQKA